MGFHLKFSRMLDRKNVYFNNRSFVLNILHFLLPVTTLRDTNFVFLSLRDLYDNEIAFIEDGTLSVMTTFTYL